MEYYANLSGIRDVIEPVWKALQQNIANESDAGVYEDVRRLSLILRCCDILTTNKDREDYLLFRKMARDLLMVIFQKNKEKLYQDKPSIAPSECLEKLYEWSDMIEAGRDRDELAMKIDGTLWYYTTWVIIAAGPDDIDTIYAIMESSATMELYIGGQVFPSEYGLGPNNETTIRTNYPPVTE